MCHCSVMIVVISMGFADDWVVVSETEQCWNLAIGQESYPCLSHMIYALSQVDIELPEDLPLKEAHAIGESLQIKIEELPEVERAFVHLDFECDHKPEHSILNKLPSSQP